MPVRDVLAAENVEELDGFEIVGFGFLGGFEDFLVGDFFGDQEGDVASAARDGGEGPERFSGVAAFEEDVEIEFGKEDGVARLSAGLLQQ